MTSHILSPNSGNENSNYDVSVLNITVVISLGDTEIIYHFKALIRPRDLGKKRNW